MTPYFSIIVPVYNVAPYLREALDSVLAQTFADWECLCVDDGSTDGSGAILDEYAAKDSRFRVWHKENGGVSSARNLGLDNAQGEWICCLDADDTLALDYLSLMHVKINESNNQVDVVMATIESPGRSFPAIPGDYPILDLCNGDVFERHQLLQRCFFWGKIWRRSLFERYSIRFDEQICFSEDALVYYALLPHLKCIAFSPSKYFYRVVPTSLSRRYFASGMYLVIAEKLNELLQKLKTSIFLSDSYFNLIWRRGYYGHLFLAIEAAYVRKESNKMRRKLLKTVFESRSMLRHDVHPSHFLKCVWWNVLLCMPIRMLDAIFYLFSKNSLLIRFTPRGLL